MSIFSPPTLTVLTPQAWGIVIMGDLIRFSIASKTSLSTLHLVILSVEIVAKACEFFCKRYWVLAKKTIMTNSYETYNALLQTTLGKALIQILSNVILQVKIHYPGPIDNANRINDKWKKRHTL